MTISGRSSGGSAAGCLFGAVHRLPSVRAAPSDLLFDVARLELGRRMVLNETSGPEPLPLHFFLDHVPDDPPNCATCRG